MKNNYNSIRGTCDFHPSQTRIFNHLVRQARDIFPLFGYEEIILPLLEEQGLFVRGVGETTDIVERQMFKIEEKDIVLRPEGTAQVIRYYLEHALHKQSDFHKFFYVGPMFRGERPQKGRLRQFHHIGAEAIGSKSPYLDAEVIQVAAAILEKIGIRERELKINSLGCNEDKKKFSEDLQQSLRSHSDRLCEDCCRRMDKNPLRVLDCKEEGCKTVVLSLGLGKAHLCKACLDDFDKVLSLLEGLNIRYTYSPYLVRGLDYYTNTVFEFVSSSLGAQDAVGAGGRYNNLIQTLGGPQIPAIGFAFGIERLLLVLEKTPFGVPGDIAKNVFIAVRNESFYQEAFRLLAELRGQGIAAQMDYCGKSLKGQLRFAQKYQAHSVVIFAEDEWKENAVVLRNMVTSTQEKVKREDIISIIKGETKI